MSQGFLGEIRMIGFEFAPRSWLQCDGQIIPTGQNPALYAYIGNVYGGHGNTTFALPDLRGRTPIHKEDNDYPLGARKGVESVALTTKEMPAHTHAVFAADLTSNKITAGGHFLARANSPDNIYIPQTSSLVSLDSASITPVGGGQKHNNMQPYLTVNFIICTIGIAPLRLPSS